MKLNLSGVWEVAFEYKNERLEYKDEMYLPATTEQCGIGMTDDKETSLYLGRKWPICGRVWYKRKIVVPIERNEKYIQLILERTKFTKVWFDETYIGESFETLVPQEFELGQLVAGEHELIIMVDNDLAKQDCFPESLYNGHQYTEHTQTNWNGILGEIYLTCHEGIYIDKVLTLRQEKQLEINVKTKANERFDLSNIFAEISIYQNGTKKLVIRYKQRLEENAVKIVVSNTELELWDEYTQNLYEIEICLLDASGKELCEKYTTITGIRQVETKNNELRINSKRISLRGSLDCAIYPLTGVCPFDEESWITILKKIKLYGMNHYRFHSWCPPEAAFVVADKIGMYLQVELSCFANEFYRKEDEKYDSALEDYLYSQAKAVLEQYGNHPSFILFAVGNEMKGNLDAYNELLKALKEVRTDILYCQGSNNFLEDPITCEEDQFWVTMRTKKGENIRASFSHNDLPLGTIQSKEIIGTLASYEGATKLSSIPLISHEIGQYQSFPLITDNNKYIGPLRPDAYFILERKLKKKGLLEKNKDFYYASGALLVQCYKSEIEANLRTSNMSGFQLLGLQDFPGQGTALVGVLDSFLDNKGFVEEKDWRKFCNSVVVMATFPRYCYTIGEEIELEIYIYNYSGKNRKEKLTIELQGKELLIDSIIISDIDSKEQIVEKVYNCKLSTRNINAPCEVKLYLKYAEYENEYSLWVYPKQDIFINHIVDTANENRKINKSNKTNENNKIDDECEINENHIADEDNTIEFAVTDESNNSVWVTNTYNSKAQEVLNHNGNVLLCSSKHANSIEGFFPTDFWCYPMFKEACINSGNPVAPGTMGLLIDQEHPAMAKFPTKNYSQWQWQQVVSHSVGVILDDEKDYKLIVQVIDNFDRNHVLGLIYEKEVEQAKLLVCASNLLEHIDIPEMRQLYISLVDYYLCEEER